MWEKRPWNHISSRFLKSLWNSCNQGCFWICRVWGAQVQSRTQDSASTVPRAAGQRHGRQCGLAGKTGPFYRAVELSIEWLISSCVLSHLGSCCREEKKRTLTGYILSGESGLNWAWAHSVSYFFLRKKINAKQILDCGNCGDSSGISFIYH